MEEGTGISLLVLLGIVVCAIVLSMGLYLYYTLFMGGVSDISSDNLWNRAYKRLLSNFVVPE